MSQNDNEKNPADFVRDFKILAAERRPKATGYLSWLESEEGEKRLRTHAAEWAALVEEKNRSRNSDGNNLPASR